MARRSGGAATQDAPSAFVIGAGRVGTGLAKALPGAGVTVLGTWSRTPGHAARARRLTGAPASSGRFPDRISDADLVFLAVPDDAVEAVCRTLVDEGLVGRGQGVIHLSGCLDLHVLDAAGATGAMTGSLHPLQAFADAATAHARFAGALAVVDGPPSLSRRLSALARALSMRPVTLKPVPDGRVLYHAAAVVAAGGLVALMDLALSIAAAAGLSRKDALAGLLTLARGTLDNLERLGRTDAALTGPIVRGDAAVVRRHLQALGRLPGDPRALYRALARRALALAQARPGGIAAGGDRLRRLLGSR
jgi:predicted short-subunit dehydrogenase-like oxidoreductase (DUF2520 family)